AHDIFTGEDQGNRLHLDRRGRGVTGFGDGAEQLRPQAELVKARGTSHQKGSWTRARSSELQSRHDIAIITVGGRRSKTKPTFARKIGGDRNGRRVVEIVAINTGFCKLFWGSAGQ